MQRCLHCGLEVVYSRFRECGWEPDYSYEYDPLAWRHVDNGYAACLSSTMFATPRPEIVTLCGSTRFRGHFLAEQARLSLDGIIVISVGLFGHEEILTAAQCEIGHPIKDALDDLHKRKIDLSDRIHVINVGGYIGASTASEIAYAREHNKQITYLEPVNGEEHTAVDQATNSASHPQDT